MPDSIERKIPCPVCGAPQPFRFLEHVNVRRHPEWKELVLEGEAFDLKCSCCGKTHRISYPMIYHDPDLQLMVMLTDAGNEHEALASLEALTSADDGVPPFPSSYVIRSVSQPAELAEKVFIFDAKLDDRIIEMLKMMAIASWAHEHNGEHPGRVYLNDPATLQFVVFPEGDASPQTCTFSAEDYERCITNFAPFFPKGHRANLFVNQAWSAALLKPASRLQ